MVDRQLAASFEDIGDEYDRYRPGFPSEAVDAILPSTAEVVLDLGAGTGKFTQRLVDRGVRVVAVEPSTQMLDVLRRKLPTVEAFEGTAESIPLGDGTVDVVTVAQAFHWFDREAAAREIGRVLRSDGTLGLLWNRADPDCLWDHAAHRVAHPAYAGAEAGEESTSDDAPRAAVPGFRLLRHLELHTVERISRDDYLRRWATVSTFIVADEKTRERMLSDIETILDQHPDTQGAAHLELPKVTDVFVYTRDESTRSVP